MGVLGASFSKGEYSGRPHGPPPVVMPGLAVGPGGGKGDTSRGAGRQAGGLGGSAPTYGNGPFDPL